MQRRIPIGRLDEDVRRFHGIACGLVGQIWNAQMHRRDPRQGLIVGVESRCDSGEPRHQPPRGCLASASEAEQTFDLASLAHDKAPVAPLDQQRATKHQALFGTGEAEIVITGVFTETPNLGNHFGPIIGDNRLMILFCQHIGDYPLTIVSA
jgi:hypothetical protein